MNRTLIHPLFISLLLLLTLTACPKKDPSNGGNQGEDPGKGGVRPEIADMEKRLANSLEKLEEEFLDKTVTPVVLPFDLTLKEVTPTKFPGLHSFASAVVQEGPHRGKWLVLGGRTNGMHNLTGKSFPTQERNTNVWVLDQETGTACSAPMSGLLQNLYDALAATNHESVQIGNVLWVTGGYGWSINTQEDVTFGYLIAVDINRLVPAVLDHCGQEIPDIGHYFSHATLTDDTGDCTLFGTKTSKDGPCGLTITGGGMERIGDQLYLAFGQMFGGGYNQFLKQQQVYSCQVSRITPGDPVWGSSFEIKEFDLFIPPNPHCQPGGLLPNNHEFHRRDLNVEPAIYLADGQPTEALFTYGGVFRLEFFGFPHPIYITPSGATIDKEFKQEMSVYEAASVNLFDEASGTFHTAILGGISGNYCDTGQEGVETPQCTSTRAILGFPSYVADGTIISCQGGTDDGTDDEGHFTCAGQQQALLYKPYMVSNPELPTAMLGANAVFFADLAIPAYNNGVLKFDQLVPDQYTTVGHIYGGIEVSGGSPGNPFFTDKTRSQSKASQRVFAVQIKPLP
jgi:hypothetical protein